MKRERRCGACGRKFNTAKKLIEHLKQCKAAKIGREFLEKAQGKKDD